MNNRRVKPTSRQRLRLLIADPSAAARVSLSFLIAERTEVEVAGYAWSGTDTLRLLRKFKPDFLVLDLALPDLNGFEVLSILRRERHPATVLVLSDFPHDGYRQKALDLGARHFFYKATDFPMLAAVLNEYALRHSAAKRKPKALLTDKQG